MSLSSNSIIHFTKIIDSLKGILQNNFEIHFCKESIETHSSLYNLAVPMVSFCDIPLSEVKEHIHKYGTYGIGFTKSWAQRLGLNPVLYVDSESNLSKSFDLAYKTYIWGSNTSDGVEGLEEAEKSVLDVFRYMKNYEGELNRGGNVDKNYRYSDEREWRYVPPLGSDCRTVISQDAYDNEDLKAQRDEENEKLSKLNLSFEPNDIKYIIIENDNEIPIIVDFLRSTKGKDYSYHDTERLMTRILTTEQIKSDM